VGAYDDVLDDLVIAQEPFLALSSGKEEEREEKMQTLYQTTF